MIRRSMVLAAMIVAAALTRLLPHPMNVTPIGAMALFGGACFLDRRLAYLMPLAAMLLSDLVLGYTRYHALDMAHTQPIVYACILASAAIGQIIRDRRSVWQVGGATLAGAVLFYLVTNFAVWAEGQWYPMTAAGLADCYWQAIPYFRNSLAGDLGYSAILFGGLALLEDRVVWMNERSASLLA